jgi:hypothetical protein
MVGSIKRRIEVHVGRDKNQDALPHLQNNQNKKGSKYGSSNEVPA